MDFSDFLQARSSWQGYPRSLKGYAFEIGDPAAVRIAERARLDGDGLVFQSVCRKDSQEAGFTGREGWGWVCVGLT